MWLPEECIAFFITLLSIQIAVVVGLALIIPCLLHLCQRAIKITEAVYGREKSKTK